MSISVYTDASVNVSGLITMWSQVQDNSWGCSHGGYSSTAHIVSPAGRSASGSGGLSVSAQMGIGEDLGWYGLYTTGTFYCSCGQGTAGFGGGMSALAESGVSTVFYGYRYSTPYTPSTQTCWYAVCVMKPCSGSEYSEVISSSQACAPGVSSVWTYKKFFGIAYGCAEQSHQHTVDDPC